MSRALAGPGQGVSSSASDLGRVVCIGDGAVGLEQVGCDDLCNLVVGDRGREMRGSREMPALALVARERLVGDVTDEILEEAVLAVLR